MSVRRHVLLLAAALTAIVPLTGVPVAVAAPSTDYQQVIDLTFPTRPDARVSDTYDACRDGCARQHKAADLMGGKMWPEYATVDGVVCRIDEGTEDSYGRHLTLCGDDGREYRYLHLNNDTPGTDDGAAALEHVYGPGIREGLRVSRGQLVAYMGDSGNAEGTAPHLHLDIFDDRVIDPYGDNRINPYPSLRAALSRGDVADGSIVHSDPVRRVAGVDRVATAIALSRSLPVRGSTVVLARSDDPTDPLVAGPLAGVLEAPVLITAPDRLDPRVRDEIRRRRADHAVIVGAAPSDQVASDLRRAGLSVERLAGSNRFATADVVAKAVWEATGVSGDGIEVPATVTVADGAPGRRALLAVGQHREASRQWPDAMVGSYLGAASHQPVLLTRPDRLPSGTAGLLDGVSVTVIGGTAAIPDGVVRGLRVTRRLYGSDRYGTAVAVVDHLRETGGVDVGRVWAATGTDWPDAITAGPVVAGLGQALVLIDGSGNGAAAATSAWMHRVAGVSAEGRVIGGAKAVADRALTGFGLDLT